MLTASTPVIAVQPLAKARTRSQSDTVPLTGPVAGTVTGDAVPAVRERAKGADRQRRAQRPTKRYVGRRNAMPVVRTPRRLTRVKSARTDRPSSSVWGKRAGTAEPSAPIPADIATATFSR